MSAFQELDRNLQREIDGIAAAEVRGGTRHDQARFFARRLRADCDRRVSELDASAEAKERGAKLAMALEDAFTERYTLFAKAGGAPWDFYPIREHGQQLAKVLLGVPEADIEEAMAPYLDPIKADLMRRGFPEEEAETWCKEIAGESGAGLDDPEVAEWLAGGEPPMNCGAT